MAHPLFTVIVCTFNRETLLPRALDSLLAQTETDWEALIVDDGSVDNTTQIVKSYIQQNPNLRYMFHQNRGLASSRNIAVPAAQGEFVTFLDSDDAYTPDHLSVRRQLIEANPQADFLHGGMRIIGDEYVIDRFDSSMKISLYDCIIDGTFVVRRSTFLSLGGFDPLPYSAGPTLYYKAVDAHINIVEVKAPTYLYDRTTPDSICNIVLDGGVEAVEHFRQAGSTPATA